MRQIDTEALKRQHPIGDVVAGYGVELRACGRALVGHCPFHADGGRPNLHVYPDSDSWYCYRCGIGGDVISFVRQIEHLGFREAVRRLDRDSPLSNGRRTYTTRRRMLNRDCRPRWGPDERACLAVAVELYHNTLLNKSAARAYVAGRGVDMGTVERCRVGFASGNGLIRQLRRCRLPFDAAVRVGLLSRDGHETMTGRVVVPEIRSGQPVWLIGRAVEPRASAVRYLSLPGRKPLLGWGSVTGTSDVYVTEGVFDWLVLRSWGYRAVALLGTQARSSDINALARFDRVYLVLDTDGAGRRASRELVRALGHRAVDILVPGVKDIAELALHANGRSIFATCIEELRDEMAA